MSFFSSASLVVLLAALAVLGESNNHGHVCTPERCKSGFTSTHLGASFSAQQLTLLPGSYFSYSSGDLSSLLSTPYKLLGSGLLNGLVPFPNSTIFYSTSATGWEIVVSTPSLPVWFESDQYSGTEHAVDLNISPQNGYQLNPGWQSIFLPDGWWVKSNDTTGTVLRGSIPNKAQLPWTAQTFGSGVQFGSDLCSPSCGPGGICLAQSCSCLTGFTGTTCSECSPGFFGPNCQPCSSQCPGKCHDGLGGSGGCMGSAGNSSSSCNCLAGTCTSGNTCQCAAGWGNSKVGLCDVCAPGFFLDHGNCLACPLGATGCSSGTTLTACATGYSLTASGICQQQGSSASCTDGQYWNGASCSSCSAACQTCTGPSTSDCLRCASPRFNLNGTCVGYDSSSGVCDSKDVGVSGIYVANNSKGRCDPCPSGCLICAIPNFSVASSPSDLKCTACHEGWVLQNGQCVEKCTGGYYFPEGSANINGTCQPCDPSKCSSCVSTATTCISCASIGLFATPTGSCVSTCPSGTYASINNSTLQCLPCPAGCETCSSNSVCLTCGPSRPVLSNGACSVVCQKHQYWDPTSSSCLGCNSNCTSCIGPSQTQCVSCESGMLLKAGSCFSMACEGHTGTLPGLGLCLSHIVDDGAQNKERTWYPFLIVAFVVVGIFAVLTWLYIRRSTRNTKKRVKEFGDAWDDKEVDRRLERLDADEFHAGAKSLEPVFDDENDEEQAEEGTRQKRRNFFAMISERDKMMNTATRKSNHFLSVKRFGGTQKGDQPLSASGESSMFLTPPPPAYSPNRSTSYWFESDEKKNSTETDKPLSPSAVPQFSVPIVNQTAAASVPSSCSMTPTTSFLTPELFRPPTALTPDPPRLPRSITKKGRESLTMVDMKQFQTLRPVPIPTGGSSRRSVSYRDETETDWNNDNGSISWAEV